MVKMPNCNYCFENVITE